VHLLEPAEVEDRDARPQRGIVEEALDQRVVELEQREDRLRPARERLGELDRDLLPTAPRQPARRRSLAEHFDVVELAAIVRWRAGPAPGPRRAPPPRGAAPPPPRRGRPVPAAPGRPPPRRARRGGAPPRGPPPPPPGRCGARRCRRRRRESRPGATASPPRA